MTWKQVLSLLDTERKSQIKTTLPTIQRERQPPHLCRVELWTWEHWRIAVALEWKKMFDREERRPMLRGWKEKFSFEACVGRLTGRRRLWSRKCLSRVSATGRTAKCHGLFQPSATENATSTPQRGKNWARWECKWCEDAEIEHNGNHVASPWRFT